MGVLRNSHMLRKHMFVVVLFLMVLFGAVFVIDATRHETQYARVSHVSAGGITGAQCAALPENLTGWWRGERSARNELRPDVDANISGTRYTEGKVGQAFAFDGTSPVNLGWGESVRVREGGFAGNFWVKFDPAGRDTVQLREGRHILVNKMNADRTSGWQVYLERLRSGGESVNFCIAVQQGRELGTRDVVCSSGVLSTEEVAADHINSRVRADKWYFVRFGLALGPPVPAMYVQIVPEDAEWPAAVVPQKLFERIPQLEDDTALTLGFAGNPNESLKGAIDEFELAGVQPFTDILTLEPIFKNIFDADSSGVCRAEHPDIYEQQLPDVEGGTLFGTQLHVVGPDRSYQFALVGGALAPGLALSSDGVVRGVPEDVDEDTVYTATIEATSPEVQVGILQRFLTGIGVTTSFAQSGVRRELRQTVLPKVRR